MSFANPIWLLGGALLLVGLLLLERQVGKRRQAALDALVSRHLLNALTTSVSSRRRAVKWWLRTGAVLLAALTLAGPQIGFDWEETRRRGIDVLIAIDVSRSMLAQDVTPDRLRRAKLAVNDLLDKLASDRVGLVAFAGSAFLQCPLTVDYAAARMLLPTTVPTLKTTTAPTPKHPTRAALCSSSSCM